MWEGKETRKQKQQHKTNKKIEQQYNNISFIRILAKTVLYAEKINKLFLTSREIHCDLT